MFLAPSLAALSLAQTAGAQTQSFDIASFTPPPGWTRVEQTGFAYFQDPRTANSPKGMGQLFLFPGRTGAGTAMENFSAEWSAHVASPLHVSAQPRTETRQLPDGWTAVTGVTPVTLPGGVLTVILFTATGAGRFMSVVATAPQGSLPLVERFFQSLKLRAPDAQAAAPSGPATTADPAARGAGDGKGLVGGYVYAVPDGWIGKEYPDGTVYASPVLSNGERCQITVLKPRPGSGNIAQDAFSAYREIFKVDPLQNSAYPYPTPTLSRGSSPQGWSYFVIRKSIGGQAGDYGSLLGTRLLAVQLGPQVAVIATTAKDPLVSMCFGEVVRDEWPGFFRSLRFGRWQLPSQEQAVAQRLAGTWTTATASVADRYSFDGKGRYATAAAAMQRHRISDDAVLQTTQAFFGDGAYTIKDNSITLTADDDRSHPAIRWLRLEQDSGDGGQTWSDRLCLLTEAAGEVCYERER